MAAPSLPNWENKYNTIDSDLVKLIHDLSAYEGQFDMENTLVEVDYDAIVSLIVNYRCIIMQNGPQTINASTKEVLDIMIEDV